MLLVVVTQAMITVTNAEAVVVGMILTVMVAVVHTGNGGGTSNGSFGVLGNGNGRLRVRDTRRQKHIYAARILGRRL